MVRGNVTARPLVLDAAFDVRFGACDDAAVRFPERRIRGWGGKRTSGVIRRACSPLGVLAQRRRVEDAILASLAPSFEASLAPAGSSLVGGVRYYDGVMCEDTQGVRGRAGCRASERRTRPAERLLVVLLLVAALQVESLRRWGAEHASTGTAMGPTSVEAFHHIDFRRDVPLEGALGLEERPDPRSETAQERLAREGLVADTVPVVRLESGSIRIYVRCVLE